MTTPIDNPAGRLHMLLSRLPVDNHNNTAFDVMCTALEIEPRDWVNFYRVWAKILVLVEEAESAIQVLPLRKKEIHAAFLTELRQYLSIANWQAAWCNVGGPLCNPECSLLKNLELCAFDLTHEKSEIEAPKLMELRQSIDELLKEILSSQLPPEIRVFLIEKSREMQKAIDDYTFYGSAGLRKTLESILGAAHFNENIKNQENSTVIKFWEIVKNLATLLSLTSNIEKLTPTAQHFLEAARDHLP